MLEDFKVNIVIGTQYWLKYANICFTKSSTEFHVRLEGKVNNDFHIQVFNNISIVLKININIQ